MIRAILPNDLPALYRLVSEEDIGYRWRFRGPIPPFDVFAASIHEGVLAQAVGVTTADGSLAGHVAAYNPDVRSGHAFIATVVSRGSIEDAVGTEISLLFIRDLLNRWPLRKLYIEMPSFNFDGLRSHLGPLVVRR